MGNREANRNIAKLSIYNDLRVDGGRARWDNLAQRPASMPLPSP